MAERQLENLDPDYDGTALKNYYSINGFVELSVIHDCAQAKSIPFRELSMYFRTREKGEREQEASERGGGEEPSCHCATPLDDDDTEKGMQR